MDILTMRREGPPAPGIRISFLSPKGWDNPAQGRAKRRPGVSGTKRLSALKGRHIISPLQGLKYESFHTQGGASLCPGLYYLSLSGSNADLIQILLSILSLVMVPATAIKKQQKHTDKMSVLLMGFDAHATFRHVLNQLTLSGWPI
jgi:hypothetical protein